MRYNGGSYTLLFDCCMVCVTNSRALVHSAIHYLWLDWIMSKPVQLLNVTRCCHQRTQHYYGKMKKINKYLKVFYFVPKNFIIGEVYCQCWFNTSSDALYIFPFMWMKVLVAQGYFVEVGKPERGSMRLRPPTLLMWWLLCYD